jgi:hypothetical protein
MFLKVMVIIIHISIIISDYIFILQFHSGREVGGAPLNILCAHI